MKSNKLTIWLLLLSLPFIMSSCTSLYVPNAPNIPMHTEKHDVKVSAHTGSCGVDFQSTVSLTDHLGVMLNTSFAANTTSIGDSYYHRHNFVELGFGYYTVVAKKNVFSIYGGIGDGYYESKENLFPISPTWNKSSVYRLFIQPSYAFASKNFDIGIALRMISLEVERGQYMGVNYFLEPMFVGKVGVPYAKVFMEAGLSLRWNEEPLLLPYRFLILNCGVQVDLDDIYKSMKNKKQQGENSPAANLNL